jgi:hypothetical protein
MAFRISMLDLALLAEAELELRKLVDQEVDLATLDSWVGERCIFHEGSWGGIGCLYLDFTRWLATQGKLSRLSRESFERCLVLNRLFLRDGMVYGPVLREDLER